MSTDSFQSRTGNPRRVGRDEGLPVVPGGCDAARVALTDGTEQTLIAAPAGGQSIYVYAMMGSNGGVSLSVIDLKDGTTVKFSFACAANGGGFAPPMLGAWKLSAGTALKVQQSAAVASYVSVVYKVE